MSCGNLCTLYKENLSKHLFLISFITLWVYFVCLYPTLFREVFAEQGSNYLFYAYNKTFAQNVWKDDAGYLVWLPRVIALLVSAIASPYWFILITNLIAQGFLAFFVSFFNHRGFRGILPDHLRFLISLIFGMIILPNYELFTYVNFVYTGFIFIGFLLFLNKENLRGGGAEYLFYCVLCALLCISKFHFVVFYPIFIACMIYHGCRKERRSLFFYIPSLITISIQLVYVALITGQAGALSYTVYNNTGILGRIIPALRGVFLWLTAYSTNFRFLGYAFFSLTAAAVLFSFLAYFAFKYYKSGMICARVFYLFIVFNLISIMFGCVTALSHFTGISEVAFKNIPFFFGRRWSVSYNMVWLAVVILLFNFILIPQNKGKKCTKIYAGILGVFLILSLLTTYPKIFKEGQYITKGNRISLSDWAKLHVLLKNEKYYIPLDPFPHGLYAASFNKGISVGQISENIYASQKAFTKNMTEVPDYDQESFTENGDLSTEDLFQNGQKIMALIAAYPKNESIYALALDAQNRVLARSYLLSSTRTMYKYLLFDQSVSAAKIRFLNQDDEPVGTEITLAAVYIEHQEEN